MQSSVSPRGHLGVVLPVMPQPVITQAAGLFAHLLPSTGRHTAPQGDVVVPALAVVLAVDDDAFGRHALRSQQCDPDSSSWSPSSPAVVSYPRPSCRHTTSASTSSHRSSQTVPHLPSRPPGRPPASEGCRCLRDKRQGSDISLGFLRNNEYLLHGATPPPPGAHLEVRHRPPRPRCPDYSRRGQTFCSGTPGGSSRSLCIPDARSGRRSPGRNPRGIPRLTLMAVAVGPAEGAGALPDEAPGVGLSVRVPAEAVVAQASARVLPHVVREVGPLQAGGAGVRVGDGAVVVAQLRESFRTREVDCRNRPTLG
ncbi:hypothetical protein EYF80_038948 [Liparis tanakae]|uniref:Uncharacterized protein n=1 Tax=Liparis tanakae TaxID=230148 RepID=A0A4Z2GCL9_9TELE|nr:hypothetical protein EYF80_038948 [Liparis tanakae]